MGYMDIDYLKDKIRDLEIEVAREQEVKEALEYKYNNLECEHNELIKELNKLRAKLDNILSELDQLL